MSKLFKLKKWLTLNDAATHLSTALEEEVTVADILQLAIDHHLTLSVNLVNHAKARIGEAVSLENAKLLIIPKYKKGLRISDMRKSGLPLVLQDNDLPDDTKKPIRLAMMKSVLTEECEKALSSLKVLLPDSETFSLGYEGQHVPDRKLVIELDEPMTVPTIDGIWDLPLIGGEALDIKKSLFHKLLGGPEITLTSLDGTWLVSESGEKWAQLQDKFDNYDLGDKRSKEAIDNIENHYFPAGGLPKDAFILVRKNELQKFIESLSEPETEKPLTQREETTYLNIIGGLLQQLTKSPSCNQERVKNTLLEEFGGLDGISKATLENKFATANRSLKANR